MSEERRPTFLERQEARARAEARAESVRQQAEKNRPPERNVYSATVRQLEQDNPAPDTPNGRMLARMKQREAQRNEEIKREDEAAERRLQASIDPEVTSFVEFVNGFGTVEDATDEEFLKLAVEKARDGDKSLIQEGRRILIRESDKIIARSEENARQREAERQEAEIQHAREQATLNKERVRNTQLQREEFRNAEHD